ncbi:MAG: ABC transporter ATP-binding protein [Deltaproteobacteria bacterium]|nr:ABC transporter ATP-binding protein [Deltaproteobacteria bacterium]
MDWAIHTEGIDFFYGARHVLREVALSVPKGAFAALMGPNGSGKTTLLHVLSGALSVERGQVQVLGRDLATWGRRELAQRVAVVPQQFELAFPFTVQEVVLLGRVPHRGPLGFDRPEDLEVARWAMEATDVLHLAGRRIGELSGGETKRVVVAKALAQQPQVLLLDEPASHLDIRHQIELYALVDRVRREQGLTVLAAVHDLNLAAAYCDLFALLKEGRLVVQGDLEQVMTYGRLKEVFDIEIYVGINELTGHRLFTPMHPRGEDP